MPQSDGGAFNGADLHYIRDVLRSSRAAHRASELARESASDPRVRALAHRARAMQAADIVATTTILVGWGYDMESPEQAGSDEVVAVEGPEVDRLFVAGLTAHAEASLASARTEMVEGFGGSSRTLAERNSRAQWRVLDSLHVLAASDQDLASAVR